MSSSTDSALSPASSISSSLVFTTLTPSLLPLVASACYSSYLEFNRSVGLPDEFPTVAAVESIMKDSMDMQQHGKAVYRVILMKPDIESDTPVIAGSGCIYFNGPDESATIGMIQISTHIQSRGLGKILMHSLISEWRQRSMKSLRLVQISSNIRSLTLYSAIGFDAKEQLLYLTGYMKMDYLNQLQQYMVEKRCIVRRMTVDDFVPCNRLFVCVHGIDRLESIRHCYQVQWSPRSEYYGWAQCFVVEQDSENGKEIIAFTSGLNAGGFGMAKDYMAYAAMMAYCTEQQKLQAKRVADGLAVQESDGEQLDSEGVMRQLPAFSPHPYEFHILPIRYPEAARYFINSGLRGIRQLTLMNWHEGFYQEPAANAELMYFPSIEW